jgi:hypothetical protein
MSRTKNLPFRKNLSRLFIACAIAIGICAASAQDLHVKFKAGGCCTGAHTSFVKEGQPMVRKGGGDVSFQLRSDDQLD